MRTRTSFVLKCVSTLVIGSLLCSPAQRVWAQSEGDPKLAAMAPNKCYVYANWTGGIQPDADSSNSTQRLLAEPEIQTFLGELSGRFSRFVSMAAQSAPPEQQSAIRTLAPTILPILLDSPGTLFVGPIRPTQEGLSVSAGMIVRIDDAASEIASALSIMLNAAGGDGEQTDIAGNTFFAYELPDTPVNAQLMVGSVGPYLTVALGQPTAQAITNRLSAPSAPEPPAWLAALRERTSAPNQTSIGFIDLQGIMELAKQLGGPQVAEMLQMAEPFGVAELMSLESAMGLDDTGMINQVKLRLSGPPRGVVKMLAGKPLNTDSLSHLPADSLFALAFSLDLKDTLDEVMSLMQQTSPDEAEEVANAIAQMKQRMGIDVVEILDDLGSTWTLYNAAGDGLFTGMTLTLDLDDADGAEQAIQSAKSILQEFGGTQDAPSLVTARYQGTPIHSLQFPMPMPVQPSFAIVENRLVVTLYPQAIKPLIDASPLDEKLNLEELGITGDITAFSYTDTRRQYEVLYMYASMLYGMVPALAEEMDVGPDGEMAAAMFQGMTYGMTLPSCRCVYRHLNPNVSTTSTVEDGILFTTRQTIPSVNVGVAAPVAVGLLLPAVQSARAAARRMQSSNNLKQIALALLNYESAYRRFPGAYSVDKDGTPLLSWRVHILPYIEQGNLYQQFHLDEPWDSEHNIKLLDQMPDVYRSPSSYAEPHMTVYRAIGGPDGMLTVPKQEGIRGRTFGEITDGSSNTVLCIEAYDSLAIEWTKPEEFIPSPDNYFDLFGLHTGGTNAVMCDGSVQFLSELIDEEMLERLFNIHDGKIVDLGY